MPDALPITLLVTFMVFFGFLNTHQRHAHHFQGASQAFLFALQISVISGSLVLIGLLIYYGIETAWYWPIALLFIVSIVGGLLFGWLDVAFGGLRISLLAFVGWPVAAIISYIIIRGLHP